MSQISVAVPKKLKGPIAIVDHSILALIHGAHLKVFVRQVAHLSARAISASWRGNGDR
jgi:hypothetical protein